MPLYDYYSEKTKERKEVFHSMNEEIEVLDSKGNKMKRIFLPGHGGDIIKGGTRKRTLRQKFGRKRTENMPTPTESAQAKAQQSAEKAHFNNMNKFDPKNPYKQFR